MAFKKGNQFRARPGGKGSKAGGQRSLFGGRDAASAAGGRSSGS